MYSGGLNFLQKKRVSCNGIKVFELTCFVTGQGRVQVAGMLEMVPRLANNLCRIESQQAGNTVRRTIISYFLISY